MTKTTCEILFESNNTNDVFYASEIVKGNVTITLHKEKIIKGMTEKWAHRHLIVKYIE